MNYSHAIRSRKAFVYSQRTRINEGMFSSFSFNVYFIRVYRRGRHVLADETGSRALNFGLFVGFGKTYKNGVTPIS